MTETGNFTDWNYNVNKGGNQCPLILSQDHF